MPDLPSRRTREKELTAALAIMWAQAAKAPTPDNLFRVRFAMPAAAMETLRKVYIEAAGQLAAQYGMEVDSAVIEKAANRWATMYAQQLADEVSNTTFAKANQAMMKSAGDGGVFQDLMAAAFSDARAESIAITEITRTITAAEQGLAAYMLAMQLGTPRNTWHTAGDERVCDVCGPLDGTGPEGYGAVSISGPPAHPRCRCWLEWE